LYNSDKKPKKKQDKSGMFNCEMCTNGTREHNHPEKPLSSTLFKIKPIACKHRLLRKKNNQQQQLGGKVSPIKHDSSATKTLRKYSTAKK